MNDSNVRNDRIFDIIVRSYIETAEPVGSRTLSRKFNLRLSPASIRNVMADLEDQGLLKQPHTSAGRVPTDKGYRYWVDSLMEVEELTPSEKSWAAEELERVRTVRDLVEKASHIISQFTHNAALMYVKNLKRVSFLNHLLEDLIEKRTLGDFLEEDAELFIDGISRMFDQPEFNDLEKMRPLLQAFDQKGNFLQMLLKDLDAEGVHVHIGSENAIDELENVSVVVKDYYYEDQPIGGIAVVGPTRMRYQKVVSVVEFVADAVTDAVKRF